MPVTRSWQRDLDMARTEPFPETVFVSFDLPLTTEAERTIKLLKERYVDREGNPLVLWRTDDMVTLHIPSCGIKRQFGEPLDSEA